MWVSRFAGGPKGDRQARVSAIRGRPEA